MVHKLKWDDLQIILAVARSGSASRAAASLELNHATVIRRIAAFEKANGVTLFDRQPTGMRATPACEALLEAARPIDDAILEIRQNILGQDLKLAGAIRLTTTDSIAHEILVPPLRSFRERHPEITLDLLITNTRLDLLRLDADLSIRPSRDPRSN
jgi:DNA-binding transcriptional LysR family regulator